LGLLDDDTTDDSSSDELDTDSDSEDERKPRAKPKASKQKPSAKDVVVVESDDDIILDVSKNSPSPPTSIDDVMSHLWERHGDAGTPDPKKCHKCQLYNGHKCHTNECLGHICSICHIGAENELEYYCHWCHPILAVDSPIIKNKASI